MFLVLKLILHWLFVQILEIIGNTIECGISYTGNFSVTYIYQYFIFTLFKELLTILLFDVALYNDYTFWNGIPFESCILRGLLMIRYQLVGCLHCHSIARDLLQHWMQYYLESKLIGMTFQRSFQDFRPFTTFWIYPLSTCFCFLVF